MPNRTPLTACVLGLSTLLLACGSEAPERSASKPADVDPQVVREEVPPLAPDTDSVNGCSRSQADDRRGDALVVVRFGGELGHAYSPRCVRVRAGATLRFEGPLELHPIAPGYLVDGLARLAGSSRIASREQGAELEVALPEAAVLGYFCNYHVDEGMLGAIFVEVVSEAMVEESGA